MLTVVIDAQAGSGGKGKVAAYLALKDRPDIVAASFGPNAGHTVYHNGHKLIFRHLPAGSVDPGAKIRIGPSAVIDIEVLTEEFLMLERAGLEVRDRLAIHPRAAVVTPADKEAEAVLSKISSTMKGVGSAQARKMMRSAELAGDFPSLREFTDRWSEWEIGDVLACGNNVMIETSQGFDLCLNHGVSYPFCTSRQINASQVLADFGLPPSTETTVVGVVRPFPIRVGNISAAETSGPYATDSTETTWEKIAADAGMPPEAIIELLEQEKTTVTKRQRRVFTFSFNRFRRFCDVNNPTYLALNFADQINWRDRDVDGGSFFNLSAKTREFILTLRDHWDTETNLIGTGPLAHQMVDLG